MMYFVHIHTNLSFYSIFCYLIRVNKVDTYETEYVTCLKFEAKIEMWVAWFLF